MKLLVVLLLLLVSAPVFAQAPSFQEIEESLTCQCGCGLTVHSCNHLQCGSALPLRQEIREQMGLDKGKDEILAHFASKYGEKILSSPTTSGFNLTAWVTPFIAVGIGGIFVMLTLVRWTRRTRHAVAPVAPQAAPASAAPSEHEKLLRRELDDFES